MKRLLLLSLFLIGAGCRPETETFNGYVEGEYLYIAPTTAGLLQNLFVVRGQKVKEGDKFFKLDSTALEAALVEAESQEVQAKAARDNAATEYRRAKTLMDQDSISRSDFDARKMTYDRAKAAYKSAAQKVVHVKKQLEESAPLAAQQGTVEDTYFHAGEYIASGTPVVSFLPPENVKIRFFVPQNRVPFFALGDEVSIHCDGCIEPIKAKIAFIATQSEYTPPVIYSVGSRDKLVFRIEAKPARYTPVLRPGLPVDIQRTEK